MAVHRGLLRGYGDRRKETSFASKPVDYIKKQKKSNKKIRKMVDNWLGDGVIVCYMLDSFNSPKNDHQLYSQDICSTHVYHFNNNVI